MTASGVREEPKCVGIWIRVSTEDQARGESPEHHERRARAYAEARGWTVVETYRLEAVSGKSVMGHAEAKRMLADLRKGAISGLVFSKLARLARNTKELLEFSEIFRACGADLVSLQEAIDTSSPAGRLFFTMIAAMAQWEREEIAERVQASVPIRAKLGKPIGGAAPFGYRWRDKKLEPDPDEAPVRVLLHELFLEHRRKKTVARHLNERGYRTRNGSLFSDTTVSRLLEDPTAKGLHRANYTRTDDRRKNWTVKPESEWVYNAVEPIISEELWDQCARLVASQRASLKRPARKSQHLFAGYAFCDCGQKMYVWAASPKYICSACRNKIPVADLEAVYREQLHHFLVSPDEIDAHDRAAVEAMDEKARLIASAESELKRIEAEDETAFQLYAGGELSKEDFGRRHRPLSERRTQLEDELPRLQAQLDVMRISAVARREALGEARDLTTRWGSLPHEEKRQIVEAITDRIVIGKADVEITLLHLPETGTSGGKATRPHGRVAFLLPGISRCLAARRKEAVLDADASLGRQLQVRRQVLGHRQVDAAAIVGVDPKTWMWWEQDTRQPYVHQYPAIIRYLEYEPWEEPLALGDSLLAQRRRQGLSIRQAAELVGIDEGTFGRWESGEWKPKPQSLRIIDRFLGSPKIVRA